jgi:short-subunit dehydrogenase
MHLPPAARSVITGAGSGFGRALALELATRGGHLVLSDVKLDATEETAQQCRQRGASSAVARSCDVSKLADIEALAASCDGPIDLVVNNAGVSSGGLVGELSIADWRWTIEVDLFGVIYGCHVFLPLLKKQGYGHILNIASAAGLLCAPRMGAYNVAKAGVVALSETIAAELAGSQVGVTVLCPTFFRTNIIADGHFADERTRQMAQRFMKGARPVEEVVAAALAAVEKNQLHALPMADARWLWRLKRLLPGSFSNVVSTGIKLREKLSGRPRARS